MSSVKIIDQNSPLISLQLERSCLGSLIKFPELYSDVSNFVTPEHFNDKDGVHKLIYSVLRRFLEKGETFDSVLIANDINSLNIKISDFDIYSYVETLNNTQITSKAALTSFNKLHKLYVARILIARNTESIKYIEGNIDKELEEIVSKIDLEHNKIISGLYKPKTDDFPNIFDGMEEEFEARADSPLKDDHFLMGPFPSINRLFGSLHRPGAITIVGARTGSNKTNLGMFYNTYVAEKYNLPLLHLDNGEMSKEELQIRAICMFTHGKVPYWAVETGEWRQNPEWSKLVKQVWKRVKNIKFYYEDISGLKPKEVISLIRRFYYNKVGRDNQFVTHFDYIKPFETTDFSTPEWKMMGHFMTDVKNFYKNEMNSAFYASLQLNRSGIYNNKDDAQIDDSENSFGMSDRIIQQATHGILLRPKTPTQIMNEFNKFGNLVCFFLKNRHLGKDFESVTSPVKVDEIINKRRSMKNYINLNVKSFFFEDRGDLREMAAKLNGKLKEKAGEDNVQL